MTNESLEVKELGQAENLIEFGPPKDVLEIDVYLTFPPSASYAEDEE